MNPSRSVTFTSSTILVLLIIGVALVAVVAGAPKNARQASAGRSQAAPRSSAANTNNQLAAAESRDDDGFNAEDQSENSEAEFAEPDGSLDKDASNANDANEASDDSDSDYSGVGEATIGAASSGKGRWSNNQQDQSNLDSSDSNIANAKVRFSPKDMATAAGHHHGHKHYVSGMLKMGAESGKKGAFKWHDKHPVGGKGR